MGYSKSRVKKSESTDELKSINKKVTVIMSIMIIGVVAAVIIIIAAVVGFNQLSGLVGTDFGQLFG